MLRQRVTCNCRSKCESLPALIPFTRGLLVDTVKPGCGANEVGIRASTLPVPREIQEMIVGGDIIIQVDGRQILSIVDARELVSNSG